MPLLYFFITLYPASVLAQAGYQCMSLDSSLLTRLILDFNLFLKSLLNPDGSRVWSTAQVNAIPIGKT